MALTNEKSQIASYTARLLRERFGKGPESVYVSLGDRFVVLHLRKFLGPVEQFLLSQDEERAFRYTRELLMKSLLPDLNGFLQTTLGVELTELYYDWGNDFADGMIVGLCREPFTDEEQTLTQYPGQEVVHRQIERITQKAQRHPDRTDSVWLNDRTLVVIREGLLIALELELIGLGYEEILKVTKRKLEKRLIVEETDIGELFGKQRVDIFVDWDFELDKSVMVMTFQ
ncbi:hypothetical protein J31TS4_17620 [Paenibacillus sp. J31TS4]|uniref:Na-translocating system protein MpsC family protein n=1 Tax=Paenibacillus sp. J31TS4 TaxID=2807195 RepID=UPI001B2916A9|nr:Na-translocating system protein MpsC family protein [Paenibacillus sp. J31TS4]GIP38482.1 hypothetical protein J31TS4_17620 [Paenibacillus sp. J31TS4]